MKLAQALIERADCQKRLEQLKQRLIRNAKVQENDPPAEDPKDLLREFEALCVQLEKLIQAINRTNCRTVVENHESIADFLARRDIIKIKFDAFQELAKSATVSQERYSKSEVRFLSTVKVSEIQKRADELAKDHRLLDARIQEINWQTELL